MGFWDGLDDGFILFPKIQSSSRMEALDEWCPQVPATQNRAAGKPYRQDQTLAFSRQLEREPRLRSKP